MKNNENYDDNDKIIPLMHYYKKNKHEGEEGEEYAQKQVESTKRFSLRKFLFLSIAFLLMFFVLMLINSDTSFNATNTVNCEMISNNGANNFDISEYREGYLTAKDGYISCYNTNQELQWELKGSKTAPTIKTNNKYALVYYTEGKVAVITNGKNENTIQTDGKISYGYINKNGYCVLFLEESGLKNRIEIYNKAGEKLYYRQNADAYIPYAMLSDDNHTLVTLELNNNNDDFSSEIRIVDIRKENSEKIIETDSVAIGGCFFYNKNDFVIVSENEAVAYSKYGNVKWSIDYSDKHISKFSYNQDGVIAFLFNNDDSANSGSEIEFYKTNGRKIGSHISEKKVFNIDMTGKYALLQVDRQLFVVNTKGKIISSADISFDVKKVIYMKNRRCALVILTSNDARMIEL